MPEISLTVVVLLCVAALAAGWVDAVVGGGGLLLLPALMMGLPAGGQHAAQFALGTNKAVAIVGTTGAAITYARRTPVDVATAVKVGLAALAGAGGGALVAAALSTEVLEPIVMVVLLGVGAFVILRPAFGTTPSAEPASRRRVLAAIGFGGVGIGFYDGLIGPGTGTFLVLALTAILHLDLVRASATAKIVNCCTNAGALAMFAWAGTVYWKLAALMAVFNLIGGTLGARTALKRGSGFVRVVLLTVVFALVTKMAYDQWLA
ncbi:sulfite exporter TauE/SafE family protein [Streptomyces sp. NPDC002644]